MAISANTRVVLASRNAHKVVEVRRILADAGLDVNLVGLDELDQVVPEVAETGATFAENALLKAQAVSDATGLPTIADDSGLCVDALNGMPGVLSARWAGQHGDDETNLRLVLSQLADVPTGRRGAQFVCAVAFVLRNDEPPMLHGTVDGRLIDEPRGSGGFGYDPIFVPTGHSKTTAELTSAEKDQLSHRGHALRSLATALTDR